jgi:hypothetical protein
MSHPESLSLSAEEGEAIISRLAVYAPSRSDCERLIQVVRLYFWLVVTVQEAKLSLKKLRTLLFGRGAKPPKLSELEALSVSAPSLGAREAMGDSCTPDEDVRPPAAAGPALASVASGAAQTDKPRGGHLPGTGRLGAEAYAGAQRVECRHEELAVGQRCPVCGQGTLYELPAGVEIRIDGHALLSGAIS